MKILVQKFGGTCLDTAEKRSLAVERIKEAVENGYSVVAVVSAMGRRGEPYATDTLIGLAREVSTEIAPRELDLLMSCGEIISAVLMVSELKARGLKALALSGGQSGIITDTAFGDARILRVEPAHVLKHLEEGFVVVVAGFQGRAESGDITTLGRGGSDTSATALAAALGAEEVEIFTDVDGIMTADPRIVPEARTIPVVTYEETVQLAREGAKVIHPRAVEIAARAGIPVRVRTMAADAKNTLVTSAHKAVASPWSDWQNGKPVTGITYRDSLVQIVIPGMFREVRLQPERVFEAVRFVSVDLINVFPEMISFVVSDQDSKETLTALEREGIPAEAFSGRAKVTVVGFGMHGKPGVMHTVAKALGSEGVKLYATSDSHMTISCLIEAALLSKAVNALHKAFHL